MPSIQSFDKCSLNLEFNLLYLLFPYLSNQATFLLHYSSVCHFSCIPSFLPSSTFPSF